MTTERYFDTAWVAAHLAVSEDWVRAHAAELGGIRLGGSRGPLRFEPARVDAAMDARRLRPAAAAAPARRPGPPRNAAGVELLPIPEGLL